ncbi:MAG TPA: flagellar hook-associated protein FlgL [Paenalcaligenes sp.]|nr:flagellar hook-associated protein FlgL [Paenalcaligenes sp.]
MRISSALYFQTGVNTINKQEGDLLHLFQQIGTGRRMITPADDPLAAAQTITLSQSQSMNERFGTNREVAMRALGETENILDGIVTHLAGLKTRLIEAGNGTLSDQDRAVLAQVLTESQETLLGAMNSTDAAGRYVFSGSQGKSQPFTEVDGRYVYQGDTGDKAARNIQVDHSRIIDVGNHGSDVFLRTAPGAMAFVHGSSGQNMGTAVVDSMQIHASRKASQIQKIELQHQDTPDAAWQVLVHYLDDHNESAIATYEFNAANTQTVVDLKEDFGVSFQIKGAAEAGDQLYYQQAKTLNGDDELNILNVLADVIAALEQPTKGDATAQARLQNSLNQALQTIDINYDNVLTVRASVGSRMNELESLADSGSLQSLQISKELSRLEDVDYYTATTQLSLRKMALEAASMAFIKIQSTSLFSMGK